MPSRLRLVARRKYQTVGSKGFKACRSLLLGLALRDIIRPSLGLRKNFSKKVKENKSNGLGKDLD